MDERLVTSVGISSRVGKIGNDHIVMLDFDDDSFEHVTDVAKLLIDKYALSDFYIIRSSDDNHYHAICIDKMSFDAARKIIEPYVDRYWLAMSLSRGEFVLRCSPRLGFNGAEITKTDSVEVLTVVSSPYHDSYIRSRAHKLALEKVYGITIPCKGKFDSMTSTKIRIAVFVEKYPSEDRVSQISKAEEQGLKAGNV